MVKRDPYNTKQLWDNWKKKKRIEKTSKYNSDLIVEFLKDMELGQNVSKKSKKGSRTPIRLLALKSRLGFFAKHYNKKELTSLTKEDVHILFKDMREGDLKKASGKAYKSVGSYVKDFKTFWNWTIKTKKVEEDIAEDLDRRDKKPSWVYLNETQFKKLANRCNPDYKALVWLLLDCGARVTESYNLRVCDFENDFTKLTIRAETSKNNYERTINLKLCSNLIKDYVEFHDLKGEDFLFQKKTTAFNKYIKNLCYKLFDPKGEGNVSHSKSKGLFSEFSLYDIRHIASCYWLKRYKTLRALMYRMGWTSEKFVKYYSEFLGQNDELSDEDMLTEEDRSKFQKLQIDFKSQNKTIKNLEKNVEGLKYFLEQVALGNIKIGKKPKKINFDREIEVHPRLRKNGNLEFVKN